MFNITITQTQIKEMPAGREWKPTGKKDDAGETELYNYTPEITKKKEVETKIYEQCTEILDLKAVIEAVNK